ncbi:MAG: glycosyltransferase [Candidatus Zixiibacteriota bacterium]|nr:MAG: glycosyltransferase [candidate division Zixibacteria bacterium]
MNKILIINSLYHPNNVGGAERSVQLLAEGLKKHGVRPVIVSTADTDSTDQVNDIKVYYLRIPNAYWMRTAKQQPAYKKPFWHLLDSYNPFAAARLADIITAEKPDLIHTNNLAGFSVSTWETARKHKLPIVHTIRDHYLLCPNSTMYKNDKNCEKQCGGCRLYSIPRKRHSLHIDAVVGVSRFILDKHLRYGYFGESKIKSFIYNAADFNLANNRTKGADEPVTFGCVGLMAPIKGTEYLLERFAAMNPDRAKLKIFGRGITKRYEKKLIERFRGDKIEFMGHRKPEDIYSQIDIAIIPSLCDDAFPRIVIESYSCGIPIIATGMGGTSEVVDVNKTGFVFDPAVPGDLEDRISKFIADPGLIEQMSVHCLEKAKIFQIDNVVKKYIEVYSQVSE